MGLCFVSDVTAHRLCLIQDRSGDVRRALVKTFPSAETKHKGILVNYFAHLLK